MVVPDAVELACLPRNGEDDQGDREEKDASDLADPSGTIRKRPESPSGDIRGKPGDREEGQGKGEEVQGPHGMRSEDRDDE